MDTKELHAEVTLLKKKVSDWESLIGWLMLVEASEKRMYGEGHERHRLPWRIKSKLVLIEKDSVAHMRTPAYGYHDSAGPHTG